MNIANSTALQLRLIKANILRRFRARYAGSRAGYAWALVEPICWVFVLKFGLASHTALPPIGTSFEVFFTTGVVLGRTWRTSTGAILPAIIRSKGQNQSLPVTARMDLVYAIWVMEMLTGGVVMIIILSCLQLWGFDATPDDLLECLSAYAAMSLFTLSFALFLGVLIIIFPALTHFKGIVLMVMFFTSGFATVVDRMPPAYRDIVVWNPLVHVVEWFREGFYPGYECAALDKEYLFTVTVLCLFVGLVGERALRLRTEKARRK